MQKYVNTVGTAQQGNNVNLLYCVQKKSSTIKVSHLIFNLLRLAICSGILDLFSIGTRAYCICFSHWLP